MYYDASQCRRRGISKHPEHVQKQPKTSLTRLQTPYTFLRTSQNTLNTQVLWVAEDVLRRLPVPPPRPVRRRGEHLQAPGHWSGGPRQSQWTEGSWPMLRGITRQDCRRLYTIDTECTGNLQMLTVLLQLHWTESSWPIWNTLTCQDCRNLARRMQDFYSARPAAPR